MTELTQPADAVCAVCGLPQNVHYDHSFTSAHDTLAPQLRERLAEAERELKETKEIDMTFLVDELKQAEAERDLARTEAADLRARLADEDARWHTLADGYAGAMRELATLRDAIWWALGQGGDFPMRQQGEGAFYWRTELRKRAGITTARRPEAEGREG